MAFRSRSGGGATPPVRRAGGRARVLRIIGGQWRGRKLRFPAGAPIRPTPDRVRETLFNWLGARVHAARCLDLFAGSGALGLEALSRGASHATFVECDSTAVRELRERLVQWGAREARVVQGDALQFLTGPATPFGLVFLDPPFDSALLPQAAALLARHGWLAAGALIYVECPARTALPALPAAWQLLRAKQAGEVGYHLLEAAQAPEVA